MQPNESPLKRFITGLQGDARLGPLLQLDAAQKSAEEIILALALRLADEIERRNPNPSSARPGAINPSAPTSTQNLTR